jgi:hypothetical protein
MLNTQFLKHAWDLDICYLHIHSEEREQNFYTVAVPYKTSVSGDYLIDKTSIRSATTWGDYQTSTLQTQALTNQLVYCLFGVSAYIH